MTNAKSAMLDHKCSFILVIGNDDDNKMIIFILVGVIVMVIVLATIIFLFLYLSRRTKTSPDNATKPVPHVPSYGNEGLENN